MSTQSLGSSEAAIIPPAAVADEREPGGRWVLLTAFALGALGLCAVAAAFALERAGRDHGLAGAVFWVGVVAILAPAAVALLAHRTARNDRIVLVAYVGMALYALKVLHDPVMFTFGDEFTHLSTLQRLLEDKSLFEPIPIAGGGVSGGYPGLHAFAATLSEVTGMSLFAAGLTVVAVARLILMFALFALFERLTGSARAAGVATLIYTATANFLFWSAQFSYQSVSLPLFVVALALIVRGSTDGRALGLAAATGVLLIDAALVATHHLTSYALAAMLVVLTLMAVRPAWRETTAFPLAVFAAGAAALWFLFVADGTGGYLSFVFERTVDAVKDAGSQGTHAPFQTDTGYVTPLPERLLALLAAGLVCLGVLWGARDAWRGRRTLSAPGLLLALGGAGYLVLYPLRLFPGAWETGNRASEFLFIGGALLLAAAAMRVQAAIARPVQALAVSAALIVVVVCGGIIQGWPAEVRLSQPLTVAVGDAVLDPPSLAAARWATDNLPSGAAYVGDEVTGRELAVNGAAFVFAGRASGVPELLRDKSLEPWQRDLLVDSKIDYVVLDRRELSRDNLVGYFFAPASKPDRGRGYYSPAVRRKFDRIPRSERVYDNGDIVIYDVRRLRLPPPLCADVDPQLGVEAITCRQITRTLALAGADATARMPGMTAHKLNQRAEWRRGSLLLTVRLELVNTTAGTTYAPDPARRNIYLSVNGRQVSRQRRAPGRDDALEGSRPIRPAGKAFGSVTFALSGDDLRDFQRDGALLGVRLPAAAGAPSEHVGVLPVSRENPRRRGR